MSRYVESLDALSVAMRLMLDEDDTLLAAAIAHPLHLAELRIQEGTAVPFTFPPPSPSAGVSVSADTAGAG